MANNLFVAHFPGQCAAQCGEPIRAGDQCVYVEVDDLDAGAVYAHAACQVEAMAVMMQTNAQTQKWGAPCPHCFMALPLSGHCDCRQ